MKSISIKVLFALIALVVVAPSIAFAHQPRITSETKTIVADPEVSKAYYANLTGEPHVYTITSDKPFDLYVGVLVPDIANQKKDVSASIIRNNDVDHPIAVLDGMNFEWKRYWEEFGRDWYWQGPEYKARAEAGTYEIRVWSSNNDSRYSLAIGEIEAFDAKEGINALNLIPTLKRNFFNENPISFVLSPFGWGYILIMFVLAFVVGFIYRFILKRFVKLSPMRVGKNIGVKDRVVRALIAVALLLFAITTTWNPVILFIAGLSLFESLFSWCLLYSAMGKNTCSVV